MTTQPKTLRLADAIGGWHAPAHASIKDCDEAAAKLRRLHEVNQELLEALKDVIYWDNGKPEWDVARAAINKATGEQA